MASFDKIDGMFTTRYAGISGCTFDERFLFKNAGWIYDPDTKAWTTSNNNDAKKLKQYAVNYAQIYIENAETIDRAILQASWAEYTDKEYPTPPGLAFMPFQKAGIEYALARKDTLIADPPGLGKTPQSIGVHNALKTNKTLIICPASLKINWQREWKRWDVHGNTVELACSISKSEKTEHGIKRWTEYYFPKTNTVIINYDMLEVFDEYIKNIDWDLVIFDECHLLKSGEAIRTKCVFGGKIKGNKNKAQRIFVPIKTKRRLFLTGTPLLSKPVELWNLVNACDPTGLGKSWTDFVFRYCGAYDDDFGINTDGATNLEELQKFLRERFMVRRDKKAVLTELPDKIREPILLPKDKLEAPVKRELSRVEKALQKYKEVVGIPEDSYPFRFIDSLIENISEAFAKQNTEEPNWEEALKSLSSPDQILFTEISSAREEVALAKVGMVVDHINKLIESDEPVICFAYHKSVIVEIKDRLEKTGLRVGVVTGSVPANKRQAIVDSFQYGKLDVILGNIIAMGVGYTLTRARFVVFAEVDWVPALMEQAEDRAWRHGQKNAVIAQYLIVDGSIEATICIAILEKMEVISNALGVTNLTKL